MKPKNEPFFRKKKYSKHEFPNIPFLKNGKPHYLRPLSVGRSDEELLRCYRSRREPVGLSRDESERYHKIIDKETEKERRAMELLIFVLVVGLFIGVVTCILASIFY
jgi:hypothetical protein